MHMGHVADGRAAIRILLLLLVAVLVLGCSSKPSRWERAATLEARGEYARALTEYQELIQRPDGLDREQLARANVKLGECLWRRERYQEAMRAFEQALAADERNAPAHLRIAELFVSSAPGRALEHAHLALAVEPDNVEAISVLGAAYSATGQLGMAKAAYARALALEPQRTTVAVALADMQARDNEVEAARTVLQQAGEARPDSALAWLALGRLEEQEGNLPAAEAAYRRAVSVENTAETNYRLAQFLQRTSRLAEAEKMLRQADALRPWLPVALPDFELQSGRVRNALQGYSAALVSGRLPAVAGGVSGARGAVIARMVEADLKLGSAGAVQLARLHLEQYKHELDVATYEALQAEIYLAAGDVERARSSAAASVAKAPQAAAPHYIFGLTHLRSGNLPQAKAEWNAALAADPGFVPARLALAQHELQSGNPGQAEEYVAGVLREEPANFSALCIYARVLLVQKRYLAAEVMARRAAAAHGAAVEPRILKGELALAQGRPGQALAEFQQAVLLDPHSGEAIEGLVRVYRTGRITRRMIAQLEKVAGNPPPSAPLMEIAGRLYREQGWIEDAQRCFRAALALDEERHTAATELARTYADQGEIAAAARLLERSGTETATMLEAARAEHRNDLATAIRKYEEALRRGDRSGVAANNLAWLYAQQGRQLDRALMLARQALELAPQDPQVLDTLGMVHFQRREFTDAINVLRKAASLAASRAGDNPRLAEEVRQHLAAAYIRSGQPEAAAELSSR